ncbi:MAG: M20/M25/M40 family metallo-hydrolase [Actinomycetes bacterium]
MRRPLRVAAATAAFATATATVFVTSAGAATPTDTSALREAVTVDGVRAHQRALQRIANQNDGTRASGTSGYEASVAYVSRQLKGAGYTVTEQPFDYSFFQENSPSTLVRTAPLPAETYVYGADFATMEFSGSGGVTDALIVPTNDVIVPIGSAPAGSSNSGCEAADFPAAGTNQVALIQRGTCDFVVKAQNAEAAGYAAAIIFNEGQEGRTDIINGTLGTSVGIPVLDATYAVGEELFQTSGARVSITTDTQVVADTSSNVIADTSGGRADRTVVVGAHLDSVLEGPGINDNGSGTATILEIALQMKRLGVAPTNKVRFAFWGAEESGLIGSEYYVSQLTKKQQQSIAVNLNFDMVGSPNFVRFVYDGDGSDTPTAGPTGSAQVEDVFTDYFDSQGLATEPTAFDGRSDYGPFIAVGIPAGGLFTGAEGIKTAAEQAVYGGTAGVAYDPCYHQACDTFANNSNTALDQMSDAAAHATATFAMTTSAVTGTKGAGTSAGAMEFKGGHRVR